jgi:thiamine-phosphate pyrophosphorylase
MIRYLITDPKYYTNDEKRFEEVLINVLSKNKIDITCFRDKESANYEEIAKIFIKTCKEKNIKNILLNGNFSLAHQLNATGVHLTSTQFDDIKKAKDLGLYVIISCHNENDLENAIKSNADAVTYSPIFETPNKGTPKGIEVLNNITTKYENINIIALGGIIDKNQIEQISQTKAYGFASIRYFI